MARQLVEMCSGVPVQMAADHHDRVMAAVSGLPYAFAAVLALVAGRRANSDPEIWELAASGFRDTSRLAASDPEMITDLLLSNAPALLDTLGQAQAELEVLSGYLRARDPDNLFAFASQAQRCRRDWEGSNRP
jgi:prephenate dehydrogenase